MVEQVKDHKLYHVTVTKPYKQAFTANQVVYIGDTDNAFFGFYEGAREYPVNENGAIVQVKAVAWLKRVRAGTIQPELAANPREYRSGSYRALRDACT